MLQKDIKKNNNKRKKFKKLLSLYETKLFFCRREKEPKDVY